MRVAVLALLLAWPAWAQDGAGQSRLTTREDLRGFEPVGRVDIEDGGFCTGTLIAADLVLTAAHCVVDTEGNPVPAGRITFRAGLADGQSLVEAQVARTVIDPEYRPVSPAPPEIIRRDVALMQLAEPVPTTQIPPFAIALPGRGDKVSVVSYASGRAEALTWQPVCNVLGRQDGLIAVDCDVSFGSSGAPVLDRSAGYRAKIVSIISVGSTWEGRRVAVGMELPEVVARLKAALRAGRVSSEAVPEEVPRRRAGKTITVGEGGDIGARFVKP
ncbi:trypsin-like serine peptidase [Tabrizicola caldifontis]|uniref:trypsin-like serine peptidase n=1 Tax=Tabrizicola caldifontis TaxID=2528036 RepID=UPI001081D91E|nr:trypsin-like peptidase domain-containing protein [Rhodobacter sp. YIM 73028]